MSTAVQFLCDHSSMICLSHSIDTFAMTEREQVKLRWPCLGNIHRDSCKESGFHDQPINLHLSKTKTC